METKKNEIEDKIIVYVSLGVRVIVQLLPHLTFSTCYGCYCCHVGVVAAISTVTLGISSSCLASLSSGTQLTTILGESAAG